MKCKLLKVKKIRCKFSVDKSIKNKLKYVKK